MSPLEQIAELHKAVTEYCECNAETHYAPCHWWSHCSACDSMDEQGWPCPTWVLATQTPAVAETWNVLVRDRDPQAALEQAQALERDS